MKFYYRHPPRSPCFPGYFCFCSWFSQFPTACSSTDAQPDDQCGFQAVHGLHPILTRQPPGRHVPELQSRHRARVQQVGHGARVIQWDHRVKMWSIILVIRIIGNVRARVIGFGSGARRCIRRRRRGRGGGANVHLLWITICPVVGLCLRRFRPFVIQYSIWPHK